MFIIAIGALDLGFEYIGPFQSRDKAETWAAEHIEQMPYWDILILREPSKTAGLIRGVIVS